MITKVYNIKNMGKRDTGVGKRKKSRSKKTKKRLAIKYEMLSKRQAGKKKALINFVAETASSSQTILVFGL